MEKTRLIAFGRFAAQRRQAAGLRRPETFDFLGFTHYCGETRVHGQTENAGETHGPETEDPP